MEDIGPTGSVRQSLFGPTAQAPAEISDGHLGCQAALAQFQQANAPGVAVVAFLLAEQAAEAGARVGGDQDGPAGLEDLVQSGAADGRQVLLGVDRLGGSGGGGEDVVDRAEGDVEVEQVSE
jgi:hypothetical protein